MIPSVAFVGAGPTAIYTLHALIAHAVQPFAVTIFEEQPIAGRGTPYRPGWNDPAMLSNIASIEIPPLEETLVAWLERQSVDRLDTLGIDRAEIDDRAFYPRLVLGEFFKDQFHAMIDRARGFGIVVETRTRCRVADVASGADGVLLSIRPHSGPSMDLRFDHLVLATGHQWPDQPEVRPGYFLSPWPASVLAAVPPVKVGIRGTSLTAIDAAVALALSHGAFIENDGGWLDYSPAANTHNFHLTMMSRKGLLPEADFYHPLPYEPLSICTAEAIEQLIASSDGDLLEKSYALFKQELAEVDPAYAAHTGVTTLPLEDFCDSYFAERMVVDPFEWAAANLAEAERNYADEMTVPWRYAILRMHEVIALIVPYLNDSEFERFARFFKPVFVDDYATIPHESIKRLLALHRADKLEIMSVGTRYRIDSHCAEGGAIVHTGGERLHFPVFIEATGQRPLGASDFPFPSLRKQGFVRDVSPADPDKPPRGIVVDDHFHLLSDDVPPDRLFCLSLPFILGRHPFIQGITSSHEMGVVVGQELAAAIDRAAAARSGQHTPEKAVA